MTVQLKIHWPRALGKTGRQYPRLCRRSWSKQPLLALLLSWIAVLPVSTLANPSESHQAIRDTAEGFLQKQLEQAEYSDFQIKISRLDSRLKLAQCDTPLEAYLPQAGQFIGKLSVGVRCPGSQPWSIYVPSEVSVFEQVLAASRPILRGQTVDAADVQLVRQKISPRNQAYFNNKTDILNKVASRNIPMGRAFTPQLVQAPRLVHRGEEVILIAETSNLTVRMVGKALSDGIKGEVIQVRNSASKRVIEGIVMKPGIVRVKM